MEKAAATCSDKSARKLLILMGLLTVVLIIYLQDLLPQPRKLRFFSAIGDAPKSTLDCLTAAENENLSAVYQDISISALQNKAFLPNMKNPCWKSQPPTGGLQCLPYFFVLGFPKCATTDLYDKMNRHPQICQARSKEYAWWVFARFLDPFPNSEVFTSQQIGWGIPCLQNGSHHETDRIIGDFATSNSWHHHFYFWANRTFLPAVMKLILPKASFILMLRDPVSRFISDYRYFVKNATSAEDLHRNARRMVVSFTNCLQNYSLPCCLYSDKIENMHTHNRHNKTIVPLIVGMYWYHLSKWFEFYPREQFLILRTEDYQANPQQAFSKVTAHLGLKPFTDVEWSQLGNLTESNQSLKSFKPMKATIRLLKDFYKEHNEKLVQLLDDERFYWRS